jgi:tetratricopeptide (TPR) repeat protein
MLRAKSVGILTLWLVMAGWTAVLRADNEGQADLDKATELQVAAKSMQDLEQVVRLCDSALKKGLDEANRKFAEQMLSSTLFQRAARLASAIFDQKPPDRRWPVLRKVALPDLERAVQVAPKLAEAHLLIARLHAWPGGDRERALKAAGAAISLLDDDKKQQSAALVVRAQLREDNDERLQDYARAIELDPGNVEAWQARAMTHADKGDFKQAAEDFERLLKDHADNIAGHLALGEVLTNMEKYDEAAKHIEQGIKLKPDSSLGYTIRAKLHVAQKDLKAAIADLDQALKIEPRDISALLMRARIHQENGNLVAAKDDAERILVLSPELPQGLIMRSLIAAAQGKLVDAITDMESLLEKDPNNVPYRLQLASYFIQDKRHTKAIEIFTKILDEDEDDAVARQARADTFLSTGKHAEAIADFEIALKQHPDDDGVLNNFAWVLATSPDDKLRDGKRAVTLATKACEVTEYKKAHILSTLAAAYAESGDFETAKKWSKKAVELGGKDKEVDEQLKQELQSYEQKKPWREKQQVKEKDDPVQRPRSQFEA